MKNDETVNLDEMLEDLISILFIIKLSPINKSRAFIYEKSWLK